MLLFFFFFNDTATTEIYTLSLHDALPISTSSTFRKWHRLPSSAPAVTRRPWAQGSARSEEHTSELQSLAYLVCRLLLEKKKKTKPELPKPRTSHNRATRTPRPPQRRFGAC